MILPSYSIRTIMYLAIVVALVAVVAGQAVQGAHWAIAATIAVGSPLLSWLVFVLFYGIVASFARVALAEEVHAPHPAYYPEQRRVSHDAAAESLPPQSPPPSE